MHNRDVYQKDPSTQKLVNEGVASVNDDKTSHALEALRYELDTFVCDGQYAKGMEHILATYLKNIDAAQQPAVWISGFFGSGKSHLAKMLRALWVDTEFQDGAKARGLCTLPDEIRAHFKELDIAAKRYGGLHAASGTLGAGASGSVRLALLRIIFKSVGLPEKYPLARFVLWLRREGIYDAVRKSIEDQGLSWEDEIANLYVAEDLHEALIRLKPNVFSSERCSDILLNQYPDVADVTTDEMTKAMYDVLNHNGDFPLTLVVLDEVQQYIGESGERCIAVQELVEACSKNFGGKLLFIATGQTAVTGTSNLKKLEGRFTIRVELSDADVDKVIRQVILEKKAIAKAPIAQVMEENIGEISRHLISTSIKHQQQDIAYFPQDYPLLPVRRRFWEYALKVLDQTGTASQLRNQLSMVHKVIQTNLDEPLGHVVPADYLYFDAADKLLQQRILPRKVYEETMKWREGTADERLLARACGLVFLIGKFSSKNEQLGITATVDTLADLLVENIAAGSSALRSALPSLLDTCHLLMKVDDQYRIQTEESVAWNDSFEKHRNSLSSETHRIDGEREKRIQGTFNTLLSTIRLFQGQANVPRNLHITFDPQLPNDADKRLYVWVRTGWITKEEIVQSEARQAGNASPTVFVFIPKRNADDLRSQLLAYKAANNTLDEHGTPNTPEGIDAHASIETKKRIADQKIKHLLEDIFEAARIYQGGGTEIYANSLSQAITEASENAVKRLYAKFAMSDHLGWPKVYEKAHKGAADALRAVSDEGQAEQNPVCKAIRDSIGMGKTGTEIRTQFEAAPYGWSRDVVDGALMVLLVSNIIRAHDEQSKIVEAVALERKYIGKIRFTIEAVTVSAKQRLGVRKLLQRLSINSNDGELAALPELLRYMHTLADNAGGPAPKPLSPDTTGLNDIERHVGNAQLLAVYNAREILEEHAAQWAELGQEIAKRWPHWVNLQKLVEHAKNIQGKKSHEVAHATSEVEAITKGRLLLDNPDPVEPLVTTLTQVLREELNGYTANYAKGHSEGMERLGQDSNWQQLSPEQRNMLLRSESLDEASTPRINVDSTSNVLSSLDTYPLQGLADRVVALQTRFENVARKAAEECAPETQFIKVPRRTLQSHEDIKAWLRDVEQEVKKALELGPVSVG